MNAKKRTKPVFVVGTAGRRTLGETRDADIRNALRAYLSVRYKNDPDTAIFEELGLCLGRARVDLAVVNGLLHGYEIKSDRDTLRRLSDQVDIYSRVFDRATLVTGKSHLSKATEVVPDWWEIWLADASVGSLAFKSIRSGHTNPYRDSRSLVELMWLDDAMNLLERHGLAKGARGKPRYFVWDRICKHIDPEELAAAVRSQLKARAIEKGSQRSC